MPGTLAKLFVELGLHDKGLVAGLGRSEKAARGFGATWQKVFLGIGAAVSTAAIGRSLLHIANDFDSLQDTIRIGTGKTGDELKGLTDTALNVFKSIPTTMDKTGIAITELQQITGATGVTLEDLARTQLELARVTGTDLKGNIDSTSKAFEQWGVNVNDQSMVLDELFRVTQATGVPVATLADQLSQYGPILRTMGFSLEDSIALLGTMGKAGLDTGVVIAGMKIAFKNFADEGLTDTNQALKDVFTQIQNAPDDLKAGQIAIDTFGGRAGPALANSIRTGKLEYQDLLDIVLNGKDTILDAAADTNDLAENWRIFKNRLTVLALPAAMALFNFLNRIGIPVLTKAVAGVSRFAQFIKALATQFIRFTGLARLVSAFSKRFSVGFDQIMHGIDLLGESFEDGATTILRGLGKLIGSGPRLIGEFLRNLKTGFAPLDNLLDDVGDAFVDAGLLIQHILQGEWGQAFEDAKSLVGDLAQGLIDEVKLRFAAIEIGFDIAVKFGKFVWGTVIPDLWAWVQQQLGMTESVQDPMLRGLEAPTTRNTGVTLSDVAVNIAGWAWGEVADLWGWIKGQFSAGPVQDPMLGGLDTHQAIPIGTVYILPTLRLAADVDWGDLAKDIGTGVVDAVRDAAYAFSPVDMFNFGNSLGEALGPAISQAVTGAFNAFKADPVGSSIIALKIAGAIVAVFLSPFIVTGVLIAALSVWVASGIAGLAKGVATSLGIDYSGVVSGIADGISNAFDASVDWATGIISTMTDAISGIITADSFKTLGTAIANGLYEAIKVALKALVPQNVFDWLTADATAPAFNDPRRYQSEASSSAGTLKGGELVTTLPAVGTGSSMMPDFASMLKTADEFRTDLANTIVGARTDVLAIIGDLQTKSVNLFVGMRNQLSDLAESARSNVANAFVGMRNDVSSILGGLVGIASSGGWAIGDAIGSGVYYGMSAWVGTISNAAYAMVTEAISAARVAAGNPNSPSPVSYKLIGSPIGEGIFKGITDWRQPIATAMGSLVPYGGQRYSMPAAPRLAAMQGSTDRSGGVTVILNNHGTIMGVDDLADQVAPAIDRALTDAWRSRKRGLGMASR